MDFKTVINGSHLTTAERNALAAAEGDIIYNTSDNQYQFFDGVNWSSLGGGASFGDIWAANTIMDC